jgi:2-oxoacid:acceptor oxidoreductase gamma subunit (pyruvate/2-ketoisovalerate family)
MVGVVMKIIEVRWHGRGGQGAVVASDILGRAAYLDGFKGVQSFPFFGAERRGAPVQAFTRLSDSKVLLRTHVYNPDIVIVLDPSLLGVVDVYSGLKEGGVVIMNTPLKPSEVKAPGSFKIATVDALSIVQDLKLFVSGLPVYNTSMLGAFSKATGLVKISSIKEAIMEYFGPGRGEINAKAAELAYHKTILGG